MYILATVPAMMPWEKEYRFLSWCHLVGSVAPWCGSFVYHLFMNLEMGPNAYYRLLQLDMLGIWISQSFGKYETPSRIAALRWSTFGSTGDWISVLLPVAIAIELFKH